MKKTLECLKDMDIIQILALLFICFVGLLGIFGVIIEFVSIFKVPR